MRPRLPLHVFAGGALLAVLACGESEDDESSSRLRPGRGSKDGGSTTKQDGGPAAPSKGCNGGAAKQATKGLSTNLSLSVAGTDRSYDLSVPASYDPTRAYPLVVVFHGGGGTSEGARNTFSFETIAGDGAIFVYPQGQGDWNLDEPAATNPDVAFFDQLLTTLEDDLCIDASRVFATGSSNGAYQANQMGCRRGGKLRAIASHAGGGPFENDDGYDENGHLKCAGPSPAALIVHGEDDDVVALSEGQKSIEHWKWANRCNDETSPRAPDPCVAYDGCATPVVWCQIPGQGHGVWDQSPQATWEFFKSF